jgi:hypothetical protein
MIAEFRLKLDMFSRVLGYCRDHPSDDAGTIALVARLDERLARAKSLNEQAVSGKLTEHASVASKENLKITIRNHFWILEGMAELIAMDQPDIAVRFEVPSIHDSHWPFVTTSRVALAHAESLRDLFLSYGMTPTFLEDLAVLVDSYEKTVEEKIAARSTHVGAHADLKAVIGELMLVVRLLDKIHGIRFRNDAESLAAWKSAHNITWRSAGRPADRADEADRADGPVKDGRREGDHLIPSEARDLLR